MEPTRRRFLRWCGAGTAACALTGTYAFAGPTVALSHNPDTAPALARAGADLILSGHTHGGQVEIPFLGPPLLPVRRRAYYAGLYRVETARLYVNRGVGWLRRVRLFVRPEITFLTLQAGG